MAEPAAARPARGDDRSVGDLVSEAIKDLTQLVKYETDLAKAELRADLQRVGLSGALLAIAAFTCFLVLVMLCFAMAAGLIAGGVPAWAAFLIVAAALVILAAIIAGIIYLKVRRMTGLRQTRESVQDSLAMLRRDEHAGPPAIAQR
jgi:uncharacterized membrane protein YqjE